MLIGITLVYAVARWSYVATSVDVACSQIPEVAASLINVQCHSPKADISQFNVGYSGT